MARRLAVAIAVAVGLILFLAVAPTSAGDTPAHTPEGRGIVFQIEPLFPPGGGLVFLVYVFSSREGADFSLDFLLPARMMLPGQDEQKIISVFFHSVDSSSGKLAGLAPEASVEMQVLASGERDMRQGVLVRSRTESKAGRGVRVLLVELPLSTIRRMGELNIETVLFVFRGKYRRGGGDEVLTVRREFRMDTLLPSEPYNGNSPGKRQAAPPGKEGAEEF